MEDTKYSTVQLREEISRPNRLLIFVDDSGTPGQLNQYLAKDFVIYSAIFMNSDNYHKFSECALNTFKECELTIHEFHTTDMVQGIKDWENIPITKRLSIIKKWGEFLERYVEIIPHLNIGSEQYNEMMDQAKSQNVNIEKKQKNGLYKAFKIFLYKKLVHYYNNQEIIIIQDEINQKQSCYYVIKNPSNLKIFKNAIFYQNSRGFLGLQLADLAAYIINRMHIISSRIPENNGIKTVISEENLKRFSEENPFDKIIFEIYKTIHDKNKIILLTDWI
jgi:hypothetical protein